MIEWCIANPGFTFILVWVFIEAMHKVAKKALESFDNAIELERQRLESERDSEPDVLVVKGKLSDEAVERIEEFSKTTREECVTKRGA